jgi:hypothetical protein
MINYGIDGSLYLDYKAVIRKIVNLGSIFEGELLILFLKII